MLTTSAQLAAVIVSVVGRRRDSASTTRLRAKVVADITYCGMSNRSSSSASAVTIRSGVRRSAITDRSNSREPMISIRTLGPPAAASESSASRSGRARLPAAKTVSWRSGATSLAPQPQAPHSRSVVTTRRTGMIIIPTYGVGPVQAHQQKVDGTVAAIGTVLARTPRLTKSVPPSGNACLPVRRQRHVRAHRSKQARRAHVDSPARPDCSDSRQFPRDHPCDSFRPSWLTWQ